MGEGGSSNAGAAASSDAGAGTAGASNTTDAGKVGSETQDKGAGESKTGGEPGKVGAVVDDKAVTVQEVTDKSTINKSHVEGEKKEPEVKKHRYHERLAKEYPDRKLETDEDYENTHEEYVKNLEGYRERGTVANQKLIALFEAEPQIADVVSAMINGATMRSALARHMDLKDLVPEEGDPDYSDYEKNNKDRLARLEKVDQFNREFNENVNFSTKAIEEFTEENNLKPEEAEKFLTDFDNILKEIYRGKITKETLTKIMRAVKHDEAVQAAKEEGEIKGKNEAIKAEKEKEKKPDDGIPALKKTGDTIEEKEKKPEQAVIIDRIIQGAKRRSNF
jgi:hypothetical protein